MTITLLTGDCRDVLATLPERSVQCIVTSPPYYGLRRYDVQGDQIGLEPSPAEYVAALVAVFRECRRVLRDDGVLWVNLGDSYAAGGGSDYQRLDKLGERLGTGGGKKHSAHPSGRAPTPDGMVQKNLLGIPWRVAFALQDDGWILRSDIIWSKPNPMPESVTDRPTRAHEYLFLLAKQARYYYDATAIAEPSVGEAPISRMKLHDGLKAAKLQSLDASTLGTPANGTRNRRSVWQVATRPYSGAHFAVFPEQLIAPCILAGSAAQACERCGAPWGRVVERESDVVNLEEGARQAMRSAGAQTGGTQRVTLGVTEHVRRRDLGFRPTCACDAIGSARSIILDPFIGSGTTCRVAEAYGRDSIGIDLGYADIQEQRTDGIQKVMVDLL